MGKHARPEPAPTVRRERPIRLWAGGALVVVGLVVAGATMVVPELMDKVAGNLKVTVEKRASEWIAPGELPQVTLGAEGDTADLDRCTGEFTEMISYRAGGIPPLYSAHNNCGGDIILGWDIGQRVKVAGSDVVYEVVEERHAPQPSGAERLEGMSGELILQTCYYGENRMRFVALAPTPGFATSVADTSVGPNGHQ